MPITRPCPILAKASVKNVGICENILNKIVAQLNIIKHYLREYLDIKKDENNAPIAAVKQVDPVSNPWVNPLGYSYSPKILEMLL